MAEKKILAYYKDIVSDEIVQLKNIKVHNVTTFDVDERILKVPQNIGFYRQPKPEEYPIDLARGFPDMIFSTADPSHYQEQKTLHYIMTLKQRPQFNICTTRGALSDIDYDYNTDLAVINFKDCIYIKSIYPAESPSPRQSYQFELRKNLFVGKWRKISKSQHTY